MFGHRAVELVNVQIKIVFKVLCSSHWSGWSQLNLTIRVIIWLVPSLLYFQLVFSPWWYQIISWMKQQFCLNKIFMIVLSVSWSLFWTCLFFNCLLGFMFLHSSGVETPNPHSLCELWSSQFKMFEMVVFSPSFSFSAANLKMLILNLFPSE